MIIKFLGHAGVEIEDNLILLIDPWLNDNPITNIKAKDITRADYIIATHNHFDHVNDIPIIAKNTKATVVGVIETVEDLSSKGCEKILGCNIGGLVKLDGLELVFTPAFHSMSSNPSGVIINYNNKSIYHAGDTGVFSDMKLIGEMYPIDLAFIPVGGHFTMGLYEAKKAIKLINAKKIVPIHYNTFDLIKQNVTDDLVKDTNSELIILEPGQKFTL